MSYQRVDPNSDMALMQQSGIGAYNQVGDWSFELFPYAYSFEAPADSRPIPPPILGGKGMGCGCGCGGGCSKNQGLGQGLFNTGLFQSADPSTWGIGEWVAAGAALYLAGSLISDVGRGAKAAREKGTRLSRKAKKTAKTLAASGVGTGGGIALGIVGLLVVAAGGYIAYQYISGQQSSSATVTQ